MSFIYANPGEIRISLQAFKNIRIIPFILHLQMRGKCIALTKYLLTHNVEVFENLFLWKQAQKQFSLHTVKVQIRLRSLYFAERRHDLETILLL